MPRPDAAAISSARAACNRVCSPHQKPDATSAAAHAAIAAPSAPSRRPPGRPGGKQAANFGRDPLRLRVQTGMQPAAQRRQGVRRFRLRTYDADGRGAVRMGLPDRWVAGNAALTRNGCTGGGALLAGGLPVRMRHQRLERLEGRLLLVAAVGDQVQLVQHLRDVGVLDLLRQHPDGAQGARLAEIHLPFLGGVHHDGNGCRARVVLDGLHRLKAVHARHHVVHEDHVGTPARQIADRGLRALDAIDVDLVLLEDTREKETRRPRVIDDQGPLLRHARESYMRCAQDSTGFAGHHPGAGSAAHS